MSQLNGIVIVTTNAAPSRPLTGLVGVTLVLETAIAAKVVDLRGRGVPNVRLIQGSINIFTDAGGNAIAQFVNGNITASKGRWTKVFNYTGGNQFTITYDIQMIRF